MPAHAATHEGASGVAGGSSSTRRTVAKPKTIVRRPQDHACAGVNDVRSATQLVYRPGTPTGPTDPNMMDALLRDLRSSIRVLAARPGWTAATILCLAIASGASAAAF